MNILANDGLAANAIALLEEKGHKVITDTVAQDQLIDFINAENIEVLLVRSATTVRKDLIDACSNLKMIGRGGVGMDNIDVAYGRSKGLKVFNTPASSSQAVAELAMGQMFTVARSLHDAAQKMPVEGLQNFKALKKKYGKGSELRGKTLGIIGFGRIGQSLASYAAGCGMKIIACSHESDEVFQLSLDIYGNQIEIPVPNYDLEKVLKESDFISLHIPKQESGAVIAKEQFKLMKNTAVIINLARGGVIDENDLLDALNNGTIAAAGLDVFENEPTPMEALLNHPQIFTTPHVGAATMEAQDRIGLEIVKEITEA